MERLDYRGTSQIDLMAELRQTELLGEARRLRRTAAGGSQAPASNRLRVWLHRLTNRMGQGNATAPLTCSTSPTASAARR
jgi:hypothetical protein